MDIRLLPLQPEDVDRFAAEAQDAFQQAVDNTDEKAPLPVLPREDIDKSLAHPRAQSWVAWLGEQPVGGAIIYANAQTQEHECAILYIATTAHSKGIGTALWYAIERQYPMAKKWTLCTPYFEVRNIHFYLRKCGFHIVDLFKEENASESVPPGTNLMFSFVKRMDGRWE